MSLVDYNENDSDNEWIIEYILEKQLPHVYALTSSCAGNIPLDEEMAEAVIKAVGPIFRRRLKKVKAKKI